MKKRKQILSVLLASVLAGALFTGCGQNQDGSSGKSTESSMQTSTMQSSTQTQTDVSEESSEVASEGTARISEETITLTVAGMYNAGAASDWNTTEQFKEYEKRLGIKFDATTYDTTQWDSKLTLLFASDELPDILVRMGMTASDVLNYANEGYLLDFSQYLDFMPNLTRIMEEYPEYAATIRNEDGSIYAFSTLNTRTASAILTPTFISTVWLENVGMDVPETLDEFYEVLTAFKEQDANGNGDPSDEIPMGLAGESRYQSELRILWAHGIYSTNYVYHLMVDEDGKVVLGDTTENYKDFLKYMNKLYSEGLINEDAYVVASSELSERVLANTVGVALGWSKAKFPGVVEEDWYQMISLTSEKYNPGKVAVISSRVGTTFDLAASADTEHPEEIAKFIDYLFTNEGALSATNGYEGITFDFVEVNGAGVVDHTNYSEGYETNEKYRQQKAVALSAFPLYVTNAGTIYEMLDNTPTEELLTGKCYELAGLNALKEVPLREEGVEVLSDYPTVIFTEEEATVRSSLYTDITNYLMNIKAQYIIGDMDIDATWDEHLAKLNEMGLERLLEIEQAAYDRYITK